jgi:hypothetical protein
VDKLDEVGLFWLPDEPEKKVPGALIFDPETGGRLRLDGMLGANRSPEGYWRILGQSQAIASTLEHCFVTERGALGGTSTWSVGEVYTQVHFTEGEDVKFDMALVELEDMSSWLNVNGTAASTQQRSDGTWTTNVEGRWLPKQTISTDFGEIAIQQALDEKSMLPRAIALPQAYMCHLTTSGLTPKAEFLELVSDIQDLVSMGIDRTSAYTRIRFRHPDALNHRQNRIDIEYFATWRVSPGQHEKPPRELIFSFDDIGGSAGLSSWLFLAAQYRTTLARTMAVREPGMYSEDRLLNAVAAAEGLHKELTGLPNKRDEMSLKVRLIQLAQLAGPAFEAAVVDVEKWSEFLKAERNDHAHNLKQRPSSYIDDYWHMANSAYWLVVLCLLSEIPTAGPAITRATNSQGFGWMAQEVGEIIPRL